MRLRPLLLLPSGWSGPLPTGANARAASVGLCTPWSGLIAEKQNPVQGQPEALARVYRVENAHGFPEVGRDHRLPARLEVVFDQDAEREIAGVNQETCLYEVAVDGVSLGPTAGFD